ncbi:MAG: IS1182 family transposase [Janthinobacterium lividum]
MSLPPQLMPPVPDDTAHIARAAFRRGNPYVLLRDRLGTVFDDADFADLYPRLGQPAYAPWRLALVTLMQFREGLSDRQAAEAVRGRIDWKYLLALDLADAGFDFSVLCEFRARLLGSGAAERLLARLLDASREAGLLKAGRRQRTDSTHVLAAVRNLNRLELVGETLRAALNVLSVAVPGWLRALAPPEWHERYDRRVEEMRLPQTGPKRDAYVAAVGADGFLLLDALDGAQAPEGLRDLPEVAVLRRVWARHFERDAAAPGGAGSGRASGARLRPVQGRGPGDRVESPYDADARFRSKRGTNWTGYMVHLTESCDDGAPRLIVHTDTTPANVHEAMRTGPIHDALKAKRLTPSEHLADAGYVSAAHIVLARERHRIDLVGPARPDKSWQKQEEGAICAIDFAVNWERRRVRCPEGRESTTWSEYTIKPSGRSCIQVGFNAADCRPCPSRLRCTRSASRQLRLHPRPEHEALAAARARLDTETGRTLYAQRQGIEGTISQGVRAFGLRQTRYRGLAKTSLQHVAAAAAINLDRLAAWFNGRPLAPTRTSRFAALAA